jgi:tRNA (guanine-N7-)-methyltransferase
MMPPADLTPDREQRSFGRKRGRKPSARQSHLLGDLLPRLSLDLASAPPLRLADLFWCPERIRNVWLEIGFGGAEHLIWQARRSPDTGLIGCEPFQGGVVKALAAIAAEGLANIRVHPDDARPVLRWLPAGSLARVFILFPDPWHKKRHRKRRLVSRSLIGELGRVIKSGGELRFATDVGDYARAVLLSTWHDGRFRWLAEGPSDWRERPPDWPQTRYERKAIAEDRMCYFLRFVRL